MIRTNILLSCGLLLAISTYAGSISVGKDVRYPTTFETRTQVVDGKVTTVTVPTSFTTRRVGTSLKPEVATMGVSRVIRKDPGGRDIVHLRFDDGPEGKVRTGSTFKVRGVAYRAIGWRGKDYCLMNLKTREILRFRPAEG